LNFPDGQKWVGEWKNNKLNGPAIKYAADGTINEEGIFKNNELPLSLKKTTDRP